MKLTSVTEVHAYVHILRELTTKKGWKKEGIYTQNECRNNQYIKEQLLLETPENIAEIKSNEFYVEPIRKVNLSR